MRACMRPATLRSDRGSLTTCAAGIDEPKNDKGDDGADGRRDDGRNDAGAEVNSQLWQQPTADEGANDADADIGDKAVAGAADDLAGKPSRDQTDQQNDENRFIRHAHFLPSGDTPWSQIPNSRPYRMFGAAASATHRHQRQCKGVANP